MKVLQVGLTGLVYPLCQALIREGVEVTLLMSPKSDRGYSRGELDKPWIRVMHGNKLSKVMQARELAKDADVVHAHGNGTLIAPFLGKPFVAHYHGSDLREIAYKKRYRALFRNAIKGAGAVLVDTPDLLSNARDFGREAEFFPQVVDTKKFAPRKGRKKRVPVILHPGNHIWRRKGNDGLIKAFASLGPGARLVMQDDGVDFAKSKALVKELGLASRVGFVKRVPRSRMPSLYSKADVVADQFALGAFGLSALEAMACAKPVVTYYDERAYARCYSSKPPVANARGEREIAAALDSLLGSRERRSRLGSRARKWVERNHSPCVVARRAKRVYSSLA